MPAVHPEMPAVQLNNGARYCQAEAGSFLLTILGENARPVELIKHITLLCGRNSWPSSRTKIFTIPPRGVAPTIMCESLGPYLFAFESRLTITCSIRRLSATAASFDQRGDPVEGKSNSNVCERASNNGRSVATASSKTSPILSTCVFKHHAACSQARHVKQFVYKVYQPIGTSANVVQEPLLCICSGFTNLLSGAGTGKRTD